MRVARRVLRGVLIVAPNPHHYVLSMGAVFSIFAGLYYWFEKITGVQYSEFLSQLHFWVFFVGVNITFFPMHFLGVAGMPRRIPDYPDAFYVFNKIASWGSYISAFSLIIFALVLVDAFFSASEKFEMKKNSLITRIFEHSVIRAAAAFFFASVILHLLVCLYFIDKNVIAITRFLTWRLGFVLTFLVLSVALGNLAAFQNLQKDFEVFNEGPKNKSTFITYLRKYHISILVIGLVSYSLAVNVFPDNQFYSYMFGVIGFISSLLYLIHFVVYTKAFLSRSLSEIKISSSYRYNSGNRRPQTRTMFTAASVAGTATRKTIVMCLECAKGLGSALVGLELSYKLTLGGGMNSVSPPRQFLLNELFPGDRTKVWSESKAAIAIHNRAMGNPHDAIYDNLEYQAYLKDQFAGLKRRNSAPVTPLSYEQNEPYQTNKPYQPNKYYKPTRP